jgi:hypothetical protein
MLWLNDQYSFLLLDCPEFYSQAGDELFLVRKMQNWSTLKQAMSNLKHSSKFTVNYLFKFINRYSWKLG